MGILTLLNYSTRIGTVDFGRKIMLWDLIYFMDWMIAELQELELELEQQELEELGFVGCAEFIDSPDWMNALDIEFTMANHHLVDNLLY